MVRWNGVLVPAPVIPRRTVVQQLMATLDLEHTALHFAVICVAIGAVAGRVAAPALGY